jgi:hypothetical protein
MDQFYRINKHNNEEVSTTSVIGKLVILISVPCQSVNSVV